MKHLETTERQPPATADRTRRRSFRTRCLEGVSGAAIEVSDFTKRMLDK